MTAPTHVAFAITCGIVAGVPETSLGLLAAGAILPDMDHPQSAAGRLFFFLSLPLNRYLGHRKSWHGFPLWGLVTVAGLFFGPLWWVGAGALSHVFLDCLNVSGVQALSPFSEKVCVLFDRRFRVVTGSQAELALLVLFGTFAWAGHYVGTMGGFRSLIAAITGSPRMAIEQYRKKGTRLCFLRGKIRWKNGRTESGRWQVVGLEGFRGIAVMDGARVLHVPLEADILTARLECTEETLQAVNLSGWAVTRKEAWFFDGSWWRHSRPGEIVFGQVLARKLELEVADLGEDQQGDVRNQD